MVLSGRDRPVDCYTPAEMIAKRDWIRTLRRRALGVVVLVLLAATTAIALSGITWIPVVGVAIAGVAVAVHKITHRLHHYDVCLSCGQSLADEPEGVHGIACPRCGAVHSGTIRHLAQLEGQAPRLDDDSDSHPAT